MAPLVSVILGLIRFYEFLILAYVVLSWFVGSARSGALPEFYRMLGTVCEPYIGLFRRILPAAAAGSAGLDFSPLVALIVLQVVAAAVARAF